MAGKNKKENTANQAKAPPESDWLDESEPLNSEHQKLLDWLKTVNFKRVLINGIDEEDVWRKLEELNQLYESSLIAERTGYEALLDDYARSAEEKLKKYKVAVKTMKKHYDELVQMNYELEQQIEMLTGKKRGKAVNQGDHNAGYHEG